MVVNTFRMWKKEDQEFKANLTILGSSRLA